MLLGKVALDVVGLGAGSSCLRVDSEETLPVLLDERDEFYSSGHNPGRWTYGRGASSGTDRAFGSGKAPGRWNERVDACAGDIRAFGSGGYHGRWTYGGTPVLDPLEHSVLEMSRTVSLWRGRRFGTVRAFGSGKAPGRWTT